MEEMILSQQGLNLQHREEFAQISNNIIDNELPDTLSDDEIIRYNFVCVYGRIGSRQGSGSYEEIRPQVSSIINTLIKANYQLTIVTSQESWRFHWMIDRGNITHKHQTE